MSPLGLLQATTSPALSISRDVARAPAAATSELTAAVNDTVKQPATAEPPAPEGTSRGASEENASSYSTRTSFDTATGEWTLVVERHPPEVGVTVAEQKGFVSQYSARANSSATVRAAVSMQI